MKRIIEAIELQGKRVSDHPLFSRLETEPVETLVPVLAYNIGFWIMGFQDVLKVVDNAVQSPELKKYSRHHREEDTGHHFWFVADMLKLGFSWDSRIFSFFEERNLPTRVLAYRIFSEIYGLKDDRLRVAFLIALESSGHVFFGRMNQYMAERGLSKELAFFGQHHIDVEKDHTVFADESEEHIHNLVLEPAIAEEGVRMAIRVHNLFYELADHIIYQLDDEEWVTELQESKMGKGQWKLPPTNMSYMVPN